MKKRFETCTVTLTPLSPIHISAGNSDYGWGAVWIVEDEKIYILDSDRFSQKLIETDLFESYIEKVEEWTNKSDSEKEKQPNPCYEFIKNNRQNLLQNIDINNFIKGLSKTEIYAPNGTRFIRNGEGKAYIPGSSIKGAIRTAVIYAILEEYKNRTKRDYLNDEYLQNIFNGKSCIPKSTSSGFDDRKGLDEKLLKLVLEDFELTEKDDSGKPIMMSRDNPINGSITNLMRTILISDSTPIPHIKKNMSDEEIKIVMLENHDHNGNLFLNSQPLPYANNENKKQCLEPNQQSVVKFKITIDKEILRSYNANKEGFAIAFQGLRDIMKIVNNFYKKVWMFEQEYYLEKLSLPDIKNSIEERMIEKVLDFHDDESESYPLLLPNINIGLGSGMLCKTLFIAMKEEYRIKIRNLQMTGRQIDNQKRGCNGRGNPVAWEKKIAPNSRHLVFRNGVASRSLGWANLAFGKITYEDSVL